MMGCIFLLMGKTNSYRDYVINRCSHNHVINCTTINCIDDNHINVVTGNIQDYEKLINIYGKNVYPVFIHTSDEQLIRRGLDNISVSAGTCLNLCETFVAEHKYYSDEYLKSIGAWVINQGSECDSYYAFINYIKRKLSGKYDVNKI